MEEEERRVITRESLDYTRVLILPFKYGNLLSFSNEGITTYTRRDSQKNKGKYATNNIRLGCTGALVLPVKYGSRRRDRGKSKLILDGALKKYRHRKMP